MIAAYSATSQARVNAALETLFNAPGPELARLYEAMRYSVMNGGRLPLPGYAACERSVTRASQRWPVRWN
jgi:geranylgeranyl diphosphate synthase type II